MNIFTCLSCLFLLLITGCSEVGEQPAAVETANEQSRDYYQLLTYTFDSEAQVATTDAYLKDAFLPALKRFGTGPVGVFKNRLSDKDTTYKTYVLIPLASLTQVAGLDASLANDTVLQSAGAAYMDAPYDQPPYRRMESTLMQAFSDMPRMHTPSLTGPRADRIYELRSYESATEKLYRNKVDMFNAGGEVVLFDKLGFNAVFFGEVLSGSRMPNLMYMTTFENMESREAHWETFFSSLEWEALKADPKYQHNVSKADILLLYPADYSDY